MDDVIVYFTRTSRRPFDDVVELILVRAFKSLARVFFSLFFVSSCVRSAFGFKMKKKTSISLYVFQTYTLIDDINYRVLV